MGFPRFLKSGAANSPLDLDKSITVPWLDQSIKSYQDLQRTRGGSPHITEWSDTDTRYMEILCEGVSNALREDLIEFFESIQVRWGLNTFTFYPTGTTGTSYTARLAIDKMPEINWPTIRGTGRTNITLILEIS